MCSPECPDYESSDYAPVSTGDLGADNSDDDDDHHHYDIDVNDDDDDYECLKYIL